jgi:predicted ribosomally synthesized peptide with nif11-like leader
MTLEQRTLLFARLRRDPTLSKKVQDADTLDDAAALAKGAGYDVDTADMAEILYGPNSI